MQFEYSSRSLIGCAAVAIAWVAASEATAQSVGATCVDAAGVLIDGASSQILSDSTQRSANAGEISWSTVAGHRGICRLDAEGRVYRVEVTEFPRPQTDPYNLVCESRNFRRSECALRGPGTGQLVRQASRTRCVLNSNWGIDGAILWVDQGCSGTFRITPAPMWTAYDLTCESADNNRTECRLRGLADVTLTRRTSRAACREGRSWGYERDVLWVDRGCRAIFRVSPLDGASPGGTDVRRAALASCNARARDNGFEVVSERVVDIDVDHADVEMVGTRRNVRVNLYCHYDIAGRSSTLYGG